MSAYDEEELRLAKALETIGKTYIPRDVRSGNRESLATYAEKAADYGVRLAMRLRRTQGTPGVSLASSDSLRVLTETSARSTSGGEMAIGGDPTLRGQKTFTFTGSPAQTVNNGDSQATIESKIAALTAGQVMRINAGTYSGFNISNGVGITIECDPDAVMGSIALKASSVTFRGGQPLAFSHARGDAVISNVTIRDVKCVNRLGGGGSTFLFLEDQVTNLTLQNFEVQGGCYLYQMWCNDANNRSISNITIKDGTYVRTDVGTGNSMGLGRSGEGSLTGRLKFVTLSNVYADGGSEATGWFGFEHFRAEDTRFEFCDLRGGRMILSVVRSQRTSVYKTKFLFEPNRASSGFEHGGPESTSATITWCEFSTTQTGRGNGVYHNSGATGLVFRFNRATNIYAAVNYGGGSPNTGGGSIIEDNCYSGLTGGFITGASPVPANISVTRNGPTFGPCAP